MSLEGNGGVTHSGDVTVLLRRINEGHSHARNALFERLYPDLQRMAQVRMSRERTDHTLQPTALINELFLTLQAASDINWRDRAHFFAVASQAMKRLLIDYARKRRAECRGGGQKKLDICSVDIGEQPVDILQYTELIDQLQREDARMAQVVDMRCFGGLTHLEIGEALGIDERTSKRDWQVARAWLQAQLAKSNTENDG
jgi:RNA polymerase sigma-70 factor, ECF subfamily